MLSGTKSGWMAAMGLAFVVGFVVAEVGWNAAAEAEMGREAEPTFEQDRRDDGFESYSKLALQVPFNQGWPAPVLLAQTGDGLAEDDLEQTYPGISDGTYRFKSGDPVATTMVDRAYTLRRLEDRQQTTNAQLGRIADALEAIRDKPAPTVEVDMAALQQTIADSLEATATRLRTLE